LGAIGVTGTAAANALAGEADVILAVGTRLQDFTTGSASLFRAPNRQIVALNVQLLDAHKHGAVPLLADAREGLRELGAALGAWRVPDAWTRRAQEERSRWLGAAASFTAPVTAGLPSDAQVIGAVQKAARASDILVAAAGGLPGELHKHWQAEQPGGYHLEYGYSCMGYEIAGALGVKLAHPDREVIAMVGDGSYLMLNSEIATSIQLGAKLTIVLLDNGGFGCIERLQHSVGSASFNNLQGSGRGLNFVAHARGLGALASQVSLGELGGPPAATGRTWRCPRCRGGPRCRRRASATSPRAPSGSASEHPPRCQSHHLVERRPARARRRHLARDLSGAGAADWFHRHGARAQVPARAGRARRRAAAIRAGVRVRLVLSAPAAAGCARRVRSSRAAPRAAQGVRQRGAGVRRGERGRAR